MAQSGKKSQQIIWLDSKTLANIVTVYTESSADQVMALNQFISHALMVIFQNEKLISEVLKEFYSTYPQTKRFSMYVEQIEVPKIEKLKVVVCPFCLGEFVDIKHFKEHLSTCAEYSKFTNNISKQV
jgi:predicted methyltransferase